MTTLEDLKSSAVKLEAGERAELAGYLLESLDEPDDDVQEAWKAELELRMDEYEKGTSPSIPIEETLKRLRELAP